MENTDKLMKNIGRYYTDLKRDGAWSAAQEGVTNAEALAVTLGKDPLKRAPSKK